MVIAVTGAAGFIGSHLCDRLIAGGHRVRAVDSYTENYARSLKIENVRAAANDPRFVLHEGDLESMPLDGLLDGVDVIYHLAGQPGVRPSWGDDFVLYARRNIGVTQRLLEACRGRTLTKFVYASSSSIYGDAASFPTAESVCPRPISPYGVTKLAAEHLCELYRKAFGIPTVSLRLFTVYGPRQRPDMAFARLVRCAVRGEPFVLYGDGRQTRDFTYVGDVVQAMEYAARSDWVGVANIGGGNRVSLDGVLDEVAARCGRVEVVPRPPSIGEVRHTAADTAVAAAAFGYAPRVRLGEGLQRMIDRERAQRAVPA